MVFPDEKSESSISPTTRRYLARNAKIKSASVEKKVLPYLYTTFPEDVEVVIPFLENFRDSTVFDPSCGLGVFGNVFRSCGFTDFVESDLFYGEGEKRNFLAEELPHYDLLITNPPFGQKLEFLKKAYEIGKPFVFLLPMDCLSHMGTSELFMQYGVRVLVFRPFISNFLKDGKKKGNYSACAYFMGNFPELIAGEVKLEYYNRVAKAESKEPTMDDASIHLDW